MQDLISQLTNCEMNRLLFRFWRGTEFNPLISPDSANGDLGLITFGKTPLVTITGLFVICSSSFLSAKSGFKSTTTSNGSVLLVGTSRYLRVEDGQHQVANIRIDKTRHEQQLLIVYYTWTSSRLIGPQEPGANKVC
jgi:hypothetical protein